MQVLNWDKQTHKKIKRDFATVFDREVFKKVNRILSEVRERGDLALRRYTREFDGLDISQKRLKVSEGDINRAFEKIHMQDLVPILKQIQDNVSEYYQKDIPQSFDLCNPDGVRLAKKYEPLNRVGIYIPGGTAPLVSTVYMTVIPARAAGVKEIVIASPPNKETGDIDPHILAAANLLGVNEIYRVGGSQAIGALAFGTKTIPKVDKIVGPGNQYVAEAKRQVYGFVDIDMVAGPSEVAIIADHSANPDYVTCDLLAQAEHHGGIAYLITTSKKLVDAIRKRVDAGYIIQVKNLEEASEVANEIAPEHLEIMTENPDILLPLIHHAGAIFVGDFSPAVTGDYAAGPSHVLPTAGTARYFSPLSSSTFFKSSQVIRYDQQSLEKARRIVQKLTEMEGLMLHRISMETRFMPQEPIAPAAGGESIVSPREDSV